jgi:hypothetical protein
MSPAVEKIYQRMLARFSADPLRATGTRGTIVPKMTARVIVNGREFESTGEMPAVYRRFYEETLARVVPLQGAIYTVAKIEHSNYVKRTVALGLLAAAHVGAIVYLWSIGYYR